MSTKEIMREIDKLPVSERLLQAKSNSLTVLCGFVR